MVSCPRCSAARVVKDDQRSAVCPRCGRRMTVARARVLLRTGDEGSAVAALGRVNESMASGMVRDDPAWTDARVLSSPPRKTGARPRRSDIISRARALGYRKGAFTAEDLSEDADIPMEKAEALLAALLDSGDVFSPGPGRYAFVDAVVADDSADVRNGKYLGKR